jgi:hypothetical protein
VLPYRLACLHLAGLALSVVKHLGLAFPIDPRNPHAAFKLPQIGLRRFALAGTLRISNLRLLRLLLSGGPFESALAKFEFAIGHR